jgi:hypothetical protein
VCGNWESVIGASPIFLKSCSVIGDREFVRTDLEFGSLDGKHQLILCGSGAAKVLAEAKLNGVWLSEFITKQERRAMQGREPEVNLRDVVAEPGPVDLRALDRANEALRQVGCSALEFLATHPGLSKYKLAKQLRTGAWGLIIALYAEAVREGKVRQTAKDLLIREILNRYPDGWTSSDDVGPSVNLGVWRYEVKKGVRDAESWKHATAIFRQLTRDHPPPEGWKPQVQEDPLINELFDRYWPNEHENRL